MNANKSDQLINELVLYNSTQRLTNQFTDYSNVFLLPIATLTGLVTNLLSIIVSFKLDKKQLVNYFMFFNSILNFIFCFFSSFLPIFRCGSLCPYGYSFFSKVYELYFYLLVNNSILLASQTFQGLLALNRVLAFSNKYNYINIRTFKIASPVVIGVSFTIYGSVLLSNRQINKFGYMINYDESNSSIKIEYLYKLEPKVLSNEMKIFIFAVNFLQSMGYQFVLFLIDMVICLKLCSYLKSKNKRFKSIKSKQILV